MSLQAGDSLSYYEILGPLGRGGMGEVYQARDTKLGRDVAIKVIPDEFVGDDERLQRFAREARLLASLNHPGIAILHGLEQSDDRHYLVMELVRGETLAERIERGPLAIDEALRLFVQLAEALEVAHRHSIVHRDLKPANVKITPEGKVKVLDFGLAKAFEDAPAQSGSQLSQSPTLAYTGTRAGVILGTAPYMSPEQARGKSVDKRTDVWSFACCLFEALAGKRPFRGETVTDTIAAVVRAEPDWRQLPSAVPGRVVELLKRCLRKSPEERLRDLGDAKLELEAAIEDPTPIAVATASWRTPWLLAIATAALLGFVAGSKLLSNGTGIEGGRFSITLAASSSLEVNNLPISALAIVPDGSRIVYAGGIDGRSRLFVRPRDAFEAIPIAGTEGAVLPFVSPDGAWVGYYDGTASELKKIPLEGGAPITICRTIGGITRGAHWGADGNIYFNGAYYLGVHRVPASGGEPEALTTPDTKGGEKSHRFPQLLPGSKAVIFSIAEADMASFDDSVIAALTLDTGKIVPLVEGGSQPRYVPSGHLVYARNGGLMAVAFDPDRLEVRGVPKRVLDGALTSHTSGEAHYDVADDGTLVFAPGGPEYFYTHVELRERSGRSTGALDLEPGRYQTARYSPDGRRLAVWRDDGNGDIWVYDLERSAPIRLSGDWDDEYPVWTPDGERIAFSVSREGKLSTWWAPADGSEAPAPLLEEPGRPESWSPDGDRLVVRSERALSIWDRRLDEIQPFSSSNSNERNGVVSPDGRWIAYHSDASGSMEVYVTSFPERGARFRVSAPGGGGPTPFFLKPVWRRDGAELFFNRAEQIMVAAVHTGDRFEASTAEYLFDVPGLVSFDVAPDGQSVVTVSSNAEPITHLSIILHWLDELGRLVPAN